MVAHFLKSAFRSTPGHALQPICEGNPQAGFTTHFCEVQEAYLKVGDHIL